MATLAEAPPINETGEGQDSGSDEGKDEGGSEDDDEAAASAKSIEDLAGEESDEDDGAGQFLIPGTSSSMSLSAGGRRPDVSEAKLSSIPMALQGEFKKGESVRLVIDAVVGDVRFKDDLKAGVVQRTRRIHVFSPVAVTATIVE